MPKLNAPFAEAARILPFTRQTAPLSFAPAAEAGAGVDELLRPRVVSRPAKLPALTPAAALGHDARNTLFSLRLLGSLLNEPGVLNAPYKQAGHDLEQALDLLEQLVEKMIAVRAEQPSPALCTSSARKGGSHAKPVQNLGEVLESCTQLLRTAAGTHIDLYVSAEAGLPPIALSDDELLRILMNLVLNASEAMPGGGAVRITARRALSRKTPAVLLHVSDDGPGIPRLALRRIFESGFTSKRTDPKRGNAGLGLAIVRSLLQSVGGVVEAASTRGRGTTFELRIPCLGESQSEQLRGRRTSVTGAEWSETLK